MGKEYMYVKIKKIKKVYGEMIYFRKYDDLLFKSNIYIYIKDRLINYLSIKNSEKLYLIQKMNL
jgi:hypothetical protein